MDTKNKSSEDNFNATIGNYKFLKNKIYEK